MKKFLVLPLFLVILSLSGCASTQYWGYEADTIGNATNCYQITRWDYKGNFWSNGPRHTKTIGVFCKKELP